MFEDDVTDNVNLIDRNFIAKTHPYFVQSGTRRFPPNMYYQNRTLRQHRNNAFTNSGLCIFGQSKENLLPPYTFTESGPFKTAMDNPYTPVPRRNFNKYQEREIVHERPKESMQKLKPRKPLPNGVYTMHGFRKYDIRNMQIDPDLEERMRSFYNTFY